MAAYATIELNSTSGTVLVQNNQVLGSPQMGIAAGYNNPQSSFRILNNTISQNAIVTNGYGIQLICLQNFEIGDNTIVPTNGRGIDVDGYGTGLTANGTIHDNYVSVQESGDREYSADATQARALRLRNNVGTVVQRDLLIYNNTFIATTGPGLATQAYGVRISYINPKGKMDDANIILQNNLIKAIVTTADRTYSAQAFVLDGADPGIDLLIENNVFESNDTSLALGGADGGDNYDTLFLSNTLRKSNDGASVPYTGIVAGYWVHELHNIRLIDMQLDNGATATIVWQGSGKKDLTTGWLLTVNAQDQSGAALAGATVSIYDGDGKQIYAGVTGSNGSLANVLVATVVRRQKSSDPTNITTIQHGPFRVVVTFGGQRAAKTFAIVADLSATITV
jgi:hypothetical protein